MTPEIRRRIHAFRNALVLAADTRSNECFRMGRWQELNAFPHGCCDLAQYLQDGDPTLKPVIIHMETTEDFRKEYRSTIKSHVIVEVTGSLSTLPLTSLRNIRTGWCLMTEPARWALCSDISGAAAGQSRSGVFSWMRGRTKTVMNSLTG